MLELINKQALTFRIKNIEFDYIKPKYVMLKSEIILRKATVKGSTIVWNIKGSQVSYNQLKSLLNNNY